MVNLLKMVVIRQRRKVEKAEIGNLEIEIETISGRRSSD
jgi:hypothetical protein